MDDTNTGDYNTGYFNTGHFNTGHFNTGHCNTGQRNTGDYNTGHCNTGQRNTGDYNTGYYNTGYFNTGQRNTGDYNTGDYNTGWFNTTTPEVVNFFNTPTKMSDWENAEKPLWIYDPAPVTWVGESHMTETEKEENPEYKTTGGFLRKNDMKEEWRKAYESASEEEIQMVRDLPNFDYDVFEEITGLDLRTTEVKDCSGKTVVVDGVEYVLSRKEDF